MQVYHGVFIASPALWDESLALERSIHAFAKVCRTESPVAVQRLGARHGVERTASIAIVVVCPVSPSVDNPLLRFIDSKAAYFKQVRGLQEVPGTTVKQLLPIEPNLTANPAR